MIPVIRKVQNYKRAMVLKIKTKKQQ